VTDSWLEHLVRACASIESSRPGTDRPIEVHEALKDSRGCVEGAVSSGWGKTHMVADSSHHRVAKPGMAAMTTIGGIVAALGLIVFVVGTIKGNALTVDGEPDAVASADLIYNIGWVLLGLGILVMVVGIVIAKTATRVLSAAIRSAPAPMDIARRPCPTCGERVAVTARTCRFCGADLT
jgi:hypothetical protein